jgi:hypothetical protein
LTDPFPVGSRVVLARPDPYRTLRTGTVGIVVGRKPYVAEHGQPATRLVWVRHGEKATWEDWRARGEIDDVRGYFDRELEAAP